MKPIEEGDPFLRKYQPSDLKIASEFLTTWLPFLSRDLCKDCIHVLSYRIRSLNPEQHSSNTETVGREDDCHAKFCGSRSLASLEAGRSDINVY